MWGRIVSIGDRRRSSHGDPTVVFSKANRHRSLDQEKDDFLFPSSIPHPFVSAPGLGCLQNMERLQLAIIGAGPIVEKKHLPALAEVPEIAVVGLCQRTPEQLHRLADQFRIAKRSTDYRDFLADKDIDAVLIATGPTVQPKIVMDVAAAKKHIFAEKPMADTAAEAYRMAEAIQSAKVHFQIGFNKRFYYGYRLAKTLIVGGEIGQPSALQTRFWFQPGRRDALLHNGIHFFDLLCFFIGPVRTVFARRSNVPSADSRFGAPESLAVSFEFATGAVGNVLLSSQGSWDYINEHIDIIGSNQRALSIDNGRRVCVFRTGNGQPAALYENTMSAHWWSGNEEQGFTGQLRAFARGILNGANDSSPSGDCQFLTPHVKDGIRSLEVLEAVRSSLIQGTNISL